MCIYIYIYTYIHTYTYTHIHIYMYTYIHIYIYVLLIDHLYCVFSLFAYLFRCDFAVVGRRLPFFHKVEVSPKYSKHFGSYLLLLLVTAIFREILVDHSTCRMINKYFGSSGMWCSRMWCLIIIVT